MVWVLLATLAMPWLDYTRSYEQVGKNLAQNLPTQTTCVHAYQLSNEARGAMYYYAKAAFLPEQSAFSQVQCPYVLTTSAALQLQTPPEKDQAIELLQRSWEIAWWGERVSERNNLLILLRAK